MPRQPNPMAPAAPAVNPPVPVPDRLLPENNLSDLTDNAAARAALELGELATADFEDLPDGISLSDANPAAVGAVAPGASPLAARADHVHPNTAATATVTANSTQIATTAWVRDFLASSQRISCPTNTSFWALAKSGSGVESFAPFGIRFSTSTSAGLCRIFAGVGNAPLCRGLPMERINFSKRTEFSCKLAMLGTNADATCRVTLGKLSDDGHGALTRKGFGVLIQNTTLKVIAHDGTSETVGATGWTLASGIVFALRVISDGAGNVSLFINDTLIETIAGGPTGNSTDQCGLMAEIDNNASANGNSATIGPVDLVLAA